jgi:hypothetical protein
MVPVHNPTLHKNSSTCLKMLKQKFLWYHFYGTTDLIYRALNGSVSMSHTFLAKFVYLLWFSLCFHYLACCLYITCLHPFSIFSLQKIFGPIIYRLNFCRLDEHVFGLHLCPAQNIDLR